MQIRGKEDPAPEMPTTATSSGSANFHLTACQVIANESFDPNGEIAKMDPTVHDEYVKCGKHEQDGASDPAAQSHREKVAPVGEISLGNMLAVHEPIAIKDAIESQKLKRLWIKNGTNLIVKRLGT